MELPEVVTPAELAKRMGWSERRVRDLARRLGACRILGNRMVLTKEDVDAILEATKPAPLRSQTRIFRSAFPKIPDVTYEDLVKMRGPRRRVRLPRLKKSDLQGS